MLRQTENGLKVKIINNNSTWKKLENANVLVKSLGGNCLNDLDIFSRTYQAPEKDLKEIHYLSKPADMWSVGAVLYYMLCGEALYVTAIGRTVYVAAMGRSIRYSSADRLQMYGHKLNQDIFFPKDISDEVKQLIKKILKVAPKNRLKAPELIDEVRALQCAQITGSGMKKGGHTDIGGENKKSNARKRSHQINNG